MNATKKLVDLFKSEEEFVKFFIKSCLFLPKKAVEKRADEMLQSIENKRQLPIRYCKKLNDFYKVEGAKALDKKKKTDIVNFANNGKLRFVPVEIAVNIDPTGNQAIVNEIRTATGHSVSTTQSTIINYTISHIWGGTTNNPLYFSPLWNIVIVPNFLNYIMDKPQSQDPLNELIQETMKAICFKLYNPNDLMKPYLTIAPPKEVYLKQAEEIINQGLINFIEENKENVSGEIIADNQELEENSLECKLNKIKQLENKDFVFGLLNLSAEYGIFEELLPILVNQDSCKEYFSQNYPILVEDKKEVDKVRYYTDKFEYEGKSYFVTNDWYNDESKNARKNRSPFFAMISEMLLHP